MMSFDEAMNSIQEGEKCSVLLGNGFSQAWNQDIFNYQSLFKQADFGAGKTQVRSIFKRFNTYDFEAVMLRMQHAAEILEIYEGSEELIAKIKKDAESLKESLLRAIAETHPEVPYSVNQGQYSSARKFLCHFDQIFSLNYDLLLYWAINKKEIEPQDLRSDDGFRAGLTWEGYDTDQNVFFLHGGLHIYDTSTTILKHAYIKKVKKIIDQVRSNLNENKFPLFVSEPNHDKKLAKIEHNPYLQYCLVALKASQGTLFIYGHSIDESDKHIFDQIEQSKLNKVFVSLYGDPKSEKNKRTQANAQTYMSRLAVEFFNAESVPVWE
jgi:hypothetical protein